MNSKIEQSITPERIIVFILVLELVTFIFNTFGGANGTPGAGIGAIIGSLLFLMFTVFLLDSVKGKRILVYNIFRFLAFIMTVDIWLNSEEPAYNGFFIGYLLISTIALFYFRRIIKSETNI